MKQPRTTAADIESLIKAQGRNLDEYLARQPRKNAFLDGMRFALFTLQRGIGSGAAAGLAAISPPVRNRVQRKVATA